MKFKLGRLRLPAAVIAFIWVGMIAAIGMESLVKFSAPSMQLSTGFDEGRTVFAAFNKVEGGLLIGLIFCALFGELRKFEKLLIIGVAIALTLQVFWLFPTLSQQVDMVLKGVTPPRTFQHSLYGILEFCKLAMLFAMGVEILRGYPR